MNTSENHNPAYVETSTCPAMALSVLFDVICSTTIAGESESDRVIYHDSVPSVCRFCSKLTCSRNQKLKQNSDVLSLCPLCALRNKRRQRICVCWLEFGYGEVANLSFPQASLFVRVSHKKNMISILWPFSVLRLIQSELHCSCDSCSAGLAFTVLLKRKYPEVNRRR